MFNTDQCERLPGESTSTPAPVPNGLVLPHAEALIAATGADFRIGGDRAYYSPAHDFIQVPRPEAYFEPINWHRTAVHQLGHWTGRPSRLARDLSGHFGSALYAKEGLVAEMTSAFVCASLGIVPTVRHADYIGSWLEVLREDVLDADSQETGMFEVPAGGRLADTASAKAIDARHQQWAKQLPQDDDDLWPTLVTLDGDSQAALFAHCAGLTINAVHEPWNRDPQRLAHADALARAGRARKCAFSTRCARRGARHLPSSSII